MPEIAVAQDAARDGRLGRDHGRAPYLLLRQLVGYTRRDDRIQDPIGVLLEPIGATVAALEPGVFLVGEEDGRGATVFRDHDRRPDRLVLIVAESLLDLGCGDGGNVLGHTFFFQAEDGIRDGHVTGVQTCALPIYKSLNLIIRLELEQNGEAIKHMAVVQLPRILPRMVKLPREDGRQDYVYLGKLIGHFLGRSEERRVGKEWCCWWAVEAVKKNEE